jgi:hypothetical protein
MTRPSLSVSYVLTTTHSTMLQSDMADTDSSQAETPVKEKQLISDQLAEVVRKHVEHLEQSRGRNTILLAETTAA